MSKIKINQMSYYYVDFYNPVYEKLSLVINTEWKVGLIGRNGRGKTTLLKLLKGDLEPTEGKISIPVDVEYFPYENNSSYTLTMDIIKEYLGELKSIEDEMEAIIIANDETRFEDYSRLQELYLERDGYEVESKILKELDEMKLDKELLYRPFDTLSGGEKTRILLLTLFLRKKQFVLLDEPTNHLDKEGKEAVASYLQKKKGFIVVSHDRTFLDQVIDHVLAINKKDITIEKGNYSSWKANKDKKEAYELRAKERLEEEIAQLERSAKVSRNWADLGNMQKYSFAGNGRTNGVQTYMKQAKRSESRVEDHILRKKQLLRNYEEVKSLNLHQQVEIVDKYLIKIDDLSFRYKDSGPDIIQHLSLEVHTGDRIWVRGDNGAGKSTLLRLINGDVVSDCISYAEGLKVGRVGQEPLWKKGYVKEDFENTSNLVYERFVELCDSFELPENFMERPIETYSSGEVKKINIARVLAEGSQLILLDEPLNYMDTYFCEQLERAILRYQPTVLFVEHDTYFGKRIATKMIELGNS